jgi:peptidase E
MTASATWVTENNSPMFYKWRVDYDGDGVVDFLISHHDVMSENQAEEIIDFIVNSLPQDDTNREFYETNRTFLIESLTDIRFRNQG